MNDSKLKQPESVNKTDTYGKSWEELGISNDFIFGKVMQDKALLTELIQLILPDIKIGRIEIIPQKSIEEGLDVHGVRLDIYAEDENGTVYEVEMQIVVTEKLRKRSRYYGSTIDSHMLERGIPYSQLKDVYIIFICLEDLFGKGRYKYTFQNICEEDTEVKLEDGSIKIFLNAAGEGDDVKGTLKEFLNYVAGKTSENAYVKKVDEAVRIAKQNKDWRREYMQWQALEAQKKWDYMEAGREEGRKEGRAEDISRMLRMGRSPETIVEFCGYPMDLVLQVQNRMEVGLV